MTWAVGYDSYWERDVGYGVPAFCDYPDCKAEIDRGLSYVCCDSEPYGGEIGCGRYFCPKHEMPQWGKDDVMFCGHSGMNADYYSADHPDWIKHKLSDESWQQWRDENKELVENLAREYSL